jgi:hypothetical protein
MIDRTLLTEALERVVEIREELLPAALDLLDPLDEIVYSAKAWLDFPTDEQVEAAALALVEGGVQAAPEIGAITRAARAALEAVRDTMIGASDD